MKLDPRCSTLFFKLANAQQHQCLLNFLTYHAFIVKAKLLKLFLPGIQKFTSTERREEMEKTNGTKCMAGILNHEVASFECVLWPCFPEDIKEEYRVLGILSLGKCCPIKKIALLQGVTDF